MIGGPIHNRSKSLKKVKRIVVCWILRKTGHIPDYPKRRKWGASNNSELTGRLVCFSPRQHDPFPARHEKLHGVADEELFPDPPPDVELIDFRGLEVGRGVLKGVRGGKERIFLASRNVRFPENLKIRVLFGRPGETDCLPPGELR